MIGAAPFGKGNSYLSQKDAESHGFIGIANAVEAVAHQGALLVIIHNYHCQWVGCIAGGMRFLIPCVARLMIIFHDYAYWDAREGLGRAVWVVRAHNRT